MKQISVDEVKKSLDANEAIITVDVRTKEEYQRGHIQGSVSVPLDDIPTKMVSLVSDKAKKMYVYCLSGSRSVLAVAQLEQAGYKNVYNMTNGLLAWRVKGYLLSTE